MQVNFSGTELICFRKNDTQRNLMMPGPFDKTFIDSLWIEADINQHKQEMEVFTFEYIVIDDCSKTLPEVFAHAGIPVSGKVDQVPGLIDNKVIDCLGFAGLIRGLGHVFPVGKHVDQG